MASGCFQAQKAGKQVTGEVTIGAGTTATVVTVDGSTGATSGAETTATTDTTATTSTTGGAPANADIAAGKTAFVPTCGGCHTLKDAGTKGAVGPVLDDVAPLSYDKVSSQIKNGKGAMPAGLAKGQDAVNIAAYVSSAAGK